MRKLNSILVRLFVLSGLTALLLSSQFKNPSAGEKGLSNTTLYPAPDSQFIIGAFFNGIDTLHQHQYKFNFNTWHRYTGPYWGWLNRGEDHFDNDTGLYKGLVTGIIDRNHDSSMRTFMDRPIIEYLVSGQRIDYECEKLNNDFSAGRYYYYSYDNSLLVNNNNNYSISDEYDTEHGITTKVKYCKLKNTFTPDNDIIINSELRANREMSFNETNKWMQDSNYSWYVLPKIRIDSAYAADVGHFNDTVCKIVVTGWQGNVEAEFNLKVSSFKGNLDSSYNGNYKESFYQGGQLSYLIIEKSKLKNFTEKDSVFNWEALCKCDIKVYWSGKCDMWIDRVRIENEPAHQYLTLSDDYHNYLVSKVNSEIYWAGRNYNTGKPIPNYFYFEECQMSHYPMIKALNNQIRTGSGNTNELVVWLNYDLFKAHIPHCWQVQLSAQQLKGYLQDDFGINIMVMGSYSLEGWEDASYHPNTLSTAGYNPTTGVLSEPVSPGEYDNWLQDNTDYKTGGTGLIFVDKRMDSLSRLGMKIIDCVQAHGWYIPTHKLKEPTNEELEYQACLALSHNAKGIMYFSYDSWGSLDSTYGLALTNVPGYTPRTRNVYGQNKLEGVKSINDKLSKWGTHFSNFNPLETRTCNYRLQDERSSFLGGTYFSVITTYFSEPYSQCYEITPSTSSEPQSRTYIQATTFKKANETNVYYFMILNRRCTPGDDDCSGRRFVTIGLDSLETAFNDFSNWEIYDLGKDSTIIRFDAKKRNSISLGKFKPGEGKLYRIAPVSVGGGTLVADETLSGNIKCNGKIYNNGYNITINQGATLTFTDSAGIEMNGGTFTCGVNADNADAVTLQKSTNGTGWCGLTLNNCTSVGIFNTFLNGIKANDTAKAVSMTNCYNANFRRNTFSQTNNSGAIQVVYTNPSDETLILNIRECNFNMGQSGYSGVNIISNASMTTPVIVEWCTFYTSNDTSNAVMLTNVTGGAIKNNNITGFRKSIVALTSAIDIYGNRIIGCNSSYGIQCLSGSDVTMKTVSGYHLGGENYLRNYGSSSACIYSDNSLFDINYGENHFDLDDIDNSKFLTGTLSGTPADNVDATKNCFHKDSVQNIEGNHSMTWYSSNDPVGFTFAPYNCELSQNEDFIVFNYGGYNDTVYYNPGGQGSGFNPNKAINAEENNYKSLRDTINLNLRKRNYSVVEDKAKQLLTQYPDSLESVGMVQKLYIASLTLDRNGNKIGQLKTYLENLISSNSQNPALIKRAFYHIQKCKVKLGQYQSALDGFQYIMTQNPYSYEGLVASWDYAATYLQMGQGGSISGETEQMTEELNTPADTLLNRMSRNDSKTKSTNDGKKTKIFYEKVKIATKDDKTVQEEKIKQLEKTIESSKSDVTKSKAQTELTTMKTIKESVKIKKPNSVKTHVIMINNDIKKIFGIGKGSKTSNPNNVLPNTYELYQNYPNPFNPSTKIAFDLPQDGKVKLMIYDILGRQIKTLVDNELRTAGKYTVEFNGSNLASGVYFYRLQVEGGKTYTAVKKMVMIK